MKTTIIAIRHGFSVSNQENRFTGHTDIPLTDIGRRQAERCAEALIGSGISAIYSSDLLRTRETAEPTSRRLGLPIILDSGLREIYGGDWEGKLMAELTVEYPKEYADIWHNDIGHAVCPGGESVCQLSDRILRTVARIAEENAGRTICIVSHAIPIRSMRTAAAGLEAEEMNKVPNVHNASISTFEYEDGKLTPVLIDRTDHLGEDKTEFLNRV